MTINAIHIENILSFEKVTIDDINTFNCIIGRNNVGKSNLLKAIAFFYKKLDNSHIATPELNSNYTPSGFITISYDLSRLYKITSSDRNRNKPFFKNIYNLFFSNVKEYQQLNNLSHFASIPETTPTYELTLKIYSNGGAEWKEKNKKKLSLINYLFPFFYIDSRHIDLHNWDELWTLVSKIKSFNVDAIDNANLKDSIDTLTSSSGKFKKYTDLLQENLPLGHYSHREKLLSLAKSTLTSNHFECNGLKTNYQSDGTNSFHYITTYIKMILILSKGEFIHPFIYIDEPEIGLHPKMCEELVYEIYTTYKSSNFYENGEEYVTPLPSFFMSTHSPNILKETIKKFNEQHSILHFSKVNGVTKISKLSSKFAERKFLNIFSDNEARLFFSNFILFVEGATELELFGHRLLQKTFPALTKIDIYQCENNVISEAINPSRIQSAIPYLYLYDADKFYELNKTKLDNEKTRTIKFKNANKYSGIKKDSLMRDAIRYRKGFSSEYKKRLDIIEYILKLDGVKFKIDKSGLFIDNSHRFHLLISNIKKYLKTKNTYFFNTTIEGALISSESLPIFSAWLKEEYSLDLTPLINNLSQRRFITTEWLATLLCLIFSGKSQTLSNKNLAFKNPTITKIMNVLNAHYKFPNIDKTNGWVTLYLDFVFIWMEKECSENKNTNMKKMFARHYPEIHGMVNLLSFDSTRE